MKIDLNVFFDAFRAVLSDDSYSFEAAARCAKYDGGLDEIIAYALAPTRNRKAVFSIYNERLEWLPLRDDYKFLSQAKHVDDVMDAFMADGKNWRECFVKLLEARSAK